MDSKVLGVPAGDVEKAMASLASLGVPSRAVVISLAPEDSSLDSVFALVKAVCDEQAASSRIRFDVQLALEELFVNVVRHGFDDGRPRSNVWLAAWADAAGETGGQGGQRVLRIVMSDPGVPYDPLDYHWQKVEGSLGKNNKVGGLGILLVRERMDDVAYEYRDGRNVLSLTKLLESSVG